MTIMNNGMHETSHLWFLQYQKCQNQFPKGVLLKDTHAVSDIVFQLHSNAVLSVSSHIFCSVKCLHVIFAVVNHTRSGTVVTA